jgi:hypothetical protein
MEEEETIKLASQLDVINRVLTRVQQSMHG